MDNPALSAGAASLCSPDTHFLWEPPGQPISVYVRISVIDRLAAETVTARVAPAGGVLLGRIAFGGTYEVMIEGFQPVAGEFWKGFPTQPEGEARKQFDLAYSRWRPGAEQPLFALGYYRIAGDQPLTLASDDLFFIARYFSSPHNVVLLIDPGSDAPGKATFFYWQGGRIQLEQGIEPFPMDGQALLEMLQPEPPPEEEPVAELVPLGETAPVASAAPPPPPAVAQRPRWPWFALVIACTLLILAALAYVRLENWTSSPPRVLAGDATGLLRIDRAGGDLWVNWDRGTPAVATAQRGSLSILDGDFKQDLELDREQLLGGSLLYAPLTSDVSFRLRLFAADGRETSSASVRVLAGVRPQVPAENGPRPAAVPQSPPRPAVSQPAQGVPAGDGAVRRVPAPKTPAAIFHPPPGRAAQPRQTPPPDQPKPVAAEPKPAAPAVAYTAPRPIRQFAPVMSPMLKQALRSLAGTPLEVEVRLELDANGKVTSAAPVGAPQGIRKLVAEVAADAARQWRFEPARRNGQAVPSSTVIPFRFVPPAR